MAILSVPSGPIELLWLSQVRESVQPLSQQSPIRVRHGAIDGGPAVPFPERHPYCEFNLSNGLGKSHPSIFERQGHSSP